MSADPIHVFVISPLQSAYSDIKKVLGKEHHYSYHSTWMNSLDEALSQSEAPDIILASQHVPDHESDSDYLSDLCKSFRDKPLLILVDQDDQRSEVNIRRRGAQGCVNLCKIDSPNYLAQQIQFAIERKHLEREQQDLRQHVDQAQQALKEHEDRYQRDLAAARLVQAGLLPHDLDLPDTVAVAWQFEACPELAGDLFHTFQLDDEHIGFYVLDVSGHGLASALLGMQVHHALMENNQGLLRDESAGIRPCQDVLTDLNQTFQMKKPMLLYFTMLYGVIDLNNKQLNYASAGHPSPIIHKAEGHYIIPECTGIPIGMMPQSKYDANSIPLATGDRVFTYSDGIYECTNQLGEAYGRKRLVEQIQQNHKEGLNHCVVNIMQAAKNWSAAQDQSDDFAICAFELLS